MSNKELARELTDFILDSIKHHGPNDLPSIESFEQRLEDLLGTLTEDLGL